MNLIKFLQKLLIFASLPLAWLTMHFVGTRFLGQLSLVMLSFIIFTKPAVLLFPNIKLFKILLAIRRQLGIATGIFIFFHVISQAMPGFNLAQVISSAVLGGPKDFTFWGFLGFVFIIPLWLTSNNLSTRLLRRNWFRLHLLIHPLYISVLIHRGLQEGRFGLVQALFILLLLYGSRFLAARGIKIYFPKTAGLV